MAGLGGTAKDLVMYFADGGEWRGRKEGEDASLRERERKMVRFASLTMG